MNKPTIHYFESEDVLHIAIAGGPESRSIELGPTITVELDDNNEMIGVEILEFIVLGLKFSDDLRLPLFRVESDEAGVGVRAKQNKEVSRQALDVPDDHERRGGVIVRSILTIGSVRPHEATEDQVQELRSEHIVRGGVRQVDHALERCAARPEDLTERFFVEHRPLDRRGMGVAATPFDEFFLTVGDEPGYEAA